MIDSGDTSWMLVSTALVILMTPAGLAFFYGGLTQSKSVLNTINMSYAAFCVATLIWVVLGYAIAFGEGGNIYTGGWENVLLRGIGIDDVTGTIPTILFVTFQGAFAGIAVAIISGSVVERVRYSTWLIFCVLWVALCYSPIARAVWGGGVLSEIGELDFAGGTVVHINAGVSGLVLSYMVGRRKKANARPMPYSIKFTILGSAMLWFGWFGFNAGSSLAANGQAANALLVTNIAASAGGVAWLLMDWITKHHGTLTGAASGVVSGLVGITPAAGYVDASGALAIGFLCGTVGFFAVVKMKNWLGYDDTLDAFGIHGIAGIAGALLTGVFANPAIGGEAGLLYGEPSRVVAQLIGIVAVVVYSAFASAVCYKIAALITHGGRVSDADEESGLDLSYHGEEDSLSPRGESKNTDSH